MNAERRNKEFKEKLQALRIGMMGPVGVGKTTLSRILRDTWGITHYEELYRDNPFLKRFYKEDPKVWSFKTQVRFLTDKDTILSSINESSGIIDPDREMDTLYPEVHYRLGFMDEKEIVTYRMFAKDSKEARQIRDPDVYIVLNGPVPILLQRIKERGRADELLMLEKHPEYFGELSLAVSSWVDLNRGKVPMIEVNSGEIDFANIPEHRKFAIDYVESWMQFHLSQKEK